MVLRPEFVERKLQLITEDLERLGDFRSDSYEALIGNPLRLAAAYNDVDHRIVFGAIGSALEQFTSYVLQVRRFSDAQASRDRSR